MEQTDNDELIIDNIVYKNIGEFVAIDESFNEFKVIATLNDQIGLREHNYIDFSDKEGLTKAKLILEENGIDYVTSTITLSLMMESLNYLSERQVSLFLALIAFVVTVFIIQYFEIKSERKEFESLMIMGISKSKIAFRKISRFALTSLLMMILAFVLYYSLLNSIINTNIDLLFELSLAAIAFALQVTIYGLSLLLCWRKINE